MIMIGFGLKDSINTVGNKQYQDLLKYDNMLILKNSISEENKELKENLHGLIKNEILINHNAFKVKKDDKSLDAYIISPQETNDIFYKYFKLKEKDNNKKLKLKDNGVIITPKIQERFDVKIGDKIIIESLNKKRYEVKVVAVTENYVSNYIYMTKKYYEETFNEKITYNAIVSENIKSKNKIATSLLESDQVLSINFADDLEKAANETVEGLNNIIILLVVISSLLAFTVLYNLTSITISERTREIATLKVLGFTDIESNEYIYRETMITVILGIILGLIITPPLHDVVMTLLEVDHIVFLRKINIQSYIYSSILTLSFSIIMQIITYYKLKKVNMIESLKSVE